MTNPIATAMSKIMNAERAKKSEVEIYPFSKTIVKVLEILKKQGYIKNFRKTDSNVVVELKGSINKCGAISPNFSVKADGFEIYEKRYLPAKDFGVLIITTPQGMMTHYEAKEKNIGGRLIAYCY